MGENEEGEGSGEKVMEWREELKKAGKTRQTSLAAFGVEIPPEIHDHRYDIIWEKNGLVPPCKRKPGDPYWEPSE